ncbi:hypothetical protein LA76x_0755 [Lysobacter antibioticus]|uniref:Uncharacterized protein n=1 Tax=Lysobacter antibioticus TaxID=84531 RepID=A0A0S2F5W0_LYSAN|nr:hypothetical protein LA76x_0755 [Lysobacter antibioticus]
MKAKTTTRICGHNRFSVGQSWHEGDGRRTRTFDYNGVTPVPTTRPGAGPAIR